MHITLAEEVLKIEIKTAWFGLRFTGAFQRTPLVPDLSQSWLVKAAGQDVNIMQPVLCTAN